MTGSGKSGQEKKERCRPWIGISESPDLKKTLVGQPGRAEELRALCGASQKQGGALSPRWKGLALILASFPGLSTEAF